MLKRLVAALLVLTLLTGLCACDMGEEPASSSVIDNPYISSSPSLEQVDTPDYTADINATADWIFQNASVLYCDTAFGATLIEATGRRDTLEARELLPVLTADTVQLDTAENIAKSIIAAIMLGGDPKTYIEGVDLVAELRRAENPGGWFSLPEASPSPIPEPDPELTPEATDIPESTDTPEATITPAVDEAPYTALEDTLWSLIALHMARESVDEQAVSAWLRTEAHSDGGFAFDSELSEVSATALCLLALEGFTCDDAKEIYNDCMQYLIASCNAEGYFVSSAADAEPNVTDQALGVVAVIAAEENIYRGRWLFDGQTVVDKLLSFRGEDGSYPELESDDATASATAFFALICAQADSLIWNNYALADIEPEM